MKGNPEGIRECGLTLIELLAALVIAGFAVAMASRIFLSGHAQFLRRSAESEKMALFYRLKAEIQGALKGDVLSCTGGRLVMRADNGPSDLGLRLKAHMPVVIESRFRCLEPEASGTGLQEWRDAAQPPLIEYRLRIAMRGRNDSLSGSWLR